MRLAQSLPALRGADRSGNVRRGLRQAGDGVRWSFQTAAPVDFNIHHHVGKEAVFPAKQPQVSAGRDTLKVTVAQDYCWMWTKKGTAPVSSTVEVAR